jgi:hypothetical protein
MHRLFSLLHFISGVSLFFPEKGSIALAFAAMFHMYVITWMQSSAIEIADRKCV